MVARCIHCDWRTEDVTAHTCRACGAKLVVVSSLALATAKQRYDAYRAWSMETAVGPAYEQR